MANGNNCPTEAAPHVDSPEEMSQIRQRALARWDNEGGAIASMAQIADSAVLEVTNTEFIHLRIRVIALENLMIAVLAEGSEQQRQTARDMAALITPRPGFTQHPLTVHAADHINDLVARADRYRMD
ncbi:MULTISPECIES: hypothetical protein [Pseudomonadota]|jgi:hypothetical protein|uniref:Uncharacterized protein n=2 Tax=Blastomonas TaxID=150203 RepID=A0A2V3V262_9SPHN|nr:MULTISPECIES: hypothetical protein [Pseudomonadota]PXW67649.1 hypothetical protein C7451_12522 [Blastomonas natatoria]